MAEEALQGAAEAAALVGNLHDAARDELAVDLAILGRDYLALQQVRVPHDTGALESALGVQVFLERLRVRVGLLGRASRQKFYGRVVEFGRSAHTVVVTRGRRGGSGRTYRKGGRTLTVGAPYLMKVKAMAGRPYVGVPDADLDAIAARRLADFWGRTLTRAGA